MISFLENLSYLFLIFSLILVFLRFFKAKYFLDRVIIFDHVTVVLAGAALLLAMGSNFGYLVDVALLIVLLSFIATVAFAYFWESGE